MSVELNHTIVPSHDKHASAQFLADLLGIPVAGEAGPFVQVELGNGVTLHHEPGGINRRWGGRGVYFPDPNGHNMEILTRPPTDAG